MTANARFTLTSIMTNLYGMSEGWSKEKTQDSLNRSLLRVATSLLVSVVFPDANLGVFESIKQPFSQGIGKIGSLLWQVFKRLISK